MTEKTIIRLENRAKAIDLLGGVCVKCRTANKLEFDHINNDREDRYHLLSQMLKGNWNKILLELKKCQLLCHYCHIRKTKEDNGFTGYKHGTISMYINRKCRCDSCRVANTVSCRLYKLRLAETQA
jgi:hypothetical protein